MLSIVMSVGQKQSRLNLPPVDLLFSFGYIAWRYIGRRHRRTTMRTNTDKYLPLTESTAYILLALCEPLHGYGVMQKVQGMSEGTVKIGPGTLYGAFSTLEGEGLIQKAGEEERRKIYTLTNKGRQVLKEHIRRLGILVQTGLVTGNW
jgi:DNA-binding MarR family transcriptional regulator